MSLNWREIDLILHELPLEKSFLQKVEQPDFSSLVMHFYSPGQRFSLFISLAQGRISIHRISEKRKRSVPLQRFSQLLRSRIKGAKLTRVDHPGKERIIQFRFQSPGTTTLLYIRLWGGAGNIVACDENNMILDAFYRRPGKGEVSGKSFSLPEPRDAKKPEGRQFSVQDFIDDGAPSLFNRHIEDEWNRQELLESYQKHKKLLEQAAERQINRLESGVEKIKEKLDQAQKRNSFKEYGDLIFANQHLISAGDSELLCSNFYQENRDLLIPLDPALSPAENGERYYDRYKKEKRAGEFLQTDLLSMEKELSSYREIVDRCNRATVDRDSIDFFKQLLEEEKAKKRGRPKSGEEGETGLRFYSSGFTLIVGRSAKENDELLRRAVKGNDYWLHARDYPGAYVFIKFIPGKSVPLEVLLDAGNLALFFSRGKSGGKGELYYTQVKHLRRAKQGKTGLVIPTREKNLSIVLEEDRVDRLLGRKEREE